MDFEAKLRAALPHIEKTWDEEIIPVMKEYVAIPAKSPLFDADWEKHGYLQQAMTLIQEWCARQPIKNMSLDIIQHPGRTPLLLIDIPGQSDDCILLYGHMDKQPEMTGWDADLGPWQPVIKDDKLYGRGSADDGYAVFCALTAIAQLQANDIPHARCVVLIEGSEESGSTDLTYYLDECKNRIGSPDLIITLDSDCGNYEQLWSTTSLRGLVGFELGIEVLTEGIHSGYGSGFVPSTLMILRQLLDRIEDAKTGEILVPECHVDIPKKRAAEMQAAGLALGPSLLKDVPFFEHTKAISDDHYELLLNRTWRPALSLTGLDGIPSVANGGNVTLPKLTAKFSLRLPPTCDTSKAAPALEATLTSQPPFNAVISFKSGDSGSGWNAPDIAPWLKEANEGASQLFYGKSANYAGNGGSIPFMGMLGEMYPKAQFLITGVLGPHSNAHGPNEFLHIPMVKKLTGCIAYVIAAQYQHHE